MYLTKEQVDSFAAAHGNDGIRIQGKGPIYFSDAARMSDFEMIPPPSDEHERLKIQREYTQEKLRRAEEDFHQRKSWLSEQSALASRYSNFVAPSGDGVVADLQRMADNVQDLREQVADIDEQLANTPKALAERKRLEELGAARMRSAATMAQVSNIQI